ncbi:MAG TPA: hypothetical protein VKA34_07550 [Balneolales bacterium]|nr:hypothetical protein [Balneolales bacterium]
MNFLIADSGSTKTDWIFIDEDGHKIPFHTEGLNPYYHTRESVRQIVESKLNSISAMTHVSNVYFYGSGCTDQNKNKVISQALCDLFGENVKTEINSDLVGAARACCGENEGIACILGTGSNSCVYDGEKIIDHIPPLGFILGDEGSGAHIGKRIIQSYYYREMPQDLKRELEKRYNMSRPVILENIYNKPHANRFVSEFSRFGSEFKEHPFIINLIKISFTEFIDRQIINYNQCHDLEISFVGSIAFFYKHLLEEILTSKALKLGKVIQSPMEELINYHQNKVNKQ